MTWELVYKCDGKEHRRAVWDESKRFAYARVDHEEEQTNGKCVTVRGVRSPYKDKVTEMAYVRIPRRARVVGLEERRWRGG